MKTTEPCCRFPCSILIHLCIMLICATVLHAQGAPVSSRAGYFKSAKLVLYGERGRKISLHHVFIHSDSLYIAPPYKKEMYVDVDIYRNYALSELQSLRCTNTTTEVWGMLIAAGLNIYAFNSDVGRWGLLPLSVRLGWLIGRSIGRKWKTIPLHD